MKLLSDPVPTKRGSSEPYGSHRYNGMMHYKSKTSPDPKKPPNHHDAKVAKQMMFQCFQRRTRNNFLGH